jgi:hypothetical protein
LHGGLGWVGEGKRYLMAMLLTPASSPGIRVDRSTFEA